MLKNGFIFWMIRRSLISDNGRGLNRACSAIWNCFFRCWMNTRLKPPCSGWGGRLKSTLPYYTGALRPVMKLPVTAMRMCSPMKRDVKTSGKISGMGKRCLRILPERKFWVFVRRGLAPRRTRPGCLRRFGQRAMSMIRVFFRQSAATAV